LHYRSEIIDISEIDSLVLARIYDNPIYNLQSISFFNIFKDFKSNEAYIKEINKFLIYVDSKISNYNGIKKEDFKKLVQDHIITYLNVLKDSKYRAPTTIKSDFAKISKFYLFCIGGDLAKDVPTVPVNLSKWIKNQTVSKAAIFTEEQRT
jgi:site-specific recombinase XerD